MPASLIASKSVAQTDAHRTGSSHESAAERDRAKLSCRLAERHAGDLSERERYHSSELLLGNQLHCLCAKRGTQRPIHVGRAPAPLQMSQDHAAGFFPGSFLNFLSDTSADSAQTGFAVLRLIGGCD